MQRTVFGGRVRDGRPLVTYGIIAVSVLVYLVQLLPGSAVTQDYAFAPAVAAAEPWRFLTSAFLHSTGFVLHIAFNMFVLYQVGPYLEQALGRLRFLALYLVSAVGGSVGVLLLADPLSPYSWNGGVVGASGAVFGLLGALLLVQRRIGGVNRGLLVLIGLNFALGFVVPNVAWQGHLGGLLTGLALSGALVLPSGGRRAVLQVAGTGGVLALLVIASVAKLTLAGV